MSESILAKVPRKLQLQRSPPHSHNPPHPATCQSPCACCSIHPEPGCVGLEKRSLRGEEHEEAQLAPGRGGAGSRKEDGRLAVS